MSPTVLSPQQVAAPARTGQRSDIQALRALAVAAVVLFHYWPHRLPGGYVGVDVFFVISGFLITSHLLDEVRSTGRVRLAAFWARRAKRLLPASLATLLATTVAVLVVTPQALQRDFLAKVLAATLYVENWALARDSVDYQASDAATTPTQHFWSLSAEEQFYIALPLVLAAVVLLTRRGPRRRVTAVAVALGGLAAGSFVYALWYVASSPSQAYFSTATRAWEFLAGGLLAFVPAVRGRVTAGVLAWAGVAAILVSCVVFSDATPFPGWQALLPVAGAAVAIRAGGSGLARLGRLAPVAWLGAVSYAVYLWHWPFVVLVPQALGHPMGTLDKLGALALTAVLAHLSTRFLEEPVRFSPRLLGGGRSPAFVLLTCGAAMALVAAVAYTGAQRVLHQERLLEARTAQVLRGDTRCLGAQSTDPTYAPCHNPALDGVLVPAPAAAAADDGNRPECWGLDEARHARVCTLADPPGATRHLLALGDSHNNALLDAYAAVGKAQGWRIDASGQHNCYLTTAEQTSVDDQQARECTDWIASVTARARAGDIDGVIVTHLSRSRVVPAAGQTMSEAIVDGLVEAWKRLPDVPIIAVRDNPTMDRDVVTCVERDPARAATACAHPRDEAVTDDGQEAAAARVPRVRVVDLTDLYCTDTCPPVIGHVLVYRDRSHVTATWARTLAPALGQRMRAALEAR